MPSCSEEGNFSFLLESLADWIIKLTQDRLIAKNKFNIICTEAPEKILNYKAVRKLRLIYIPAWAKKKQVGLQREGS